MAMTRISTVAATLAVLLAGAGCAFEHNSNMAGPSAPQAAGTPAATPGTGAASTASLTRLWTSNALPVLPSPTNCGNFQYQITSQTATSIAGTFSAVCGGGLTVSGNAQGQLQGSSVPFTI